MASEFYTDVKSADFDGLLQSSAEVLMVDFWAPWCGPCKAIAPLLEEVAKERVGKVKLLKVNVDHEQELASKYRITGIPALMFFKGGQLKDQHVGANISKKGLLAKVDALAS